MPSDLNIQTSENSFNKCLKNLALKKESGGDDLDEDISSIFRDLRVSALSKAVSISPDVKSVTLGVNYDQNNDQETLSESPKNSSVSLCLHSSTPEKKNVSSLSKYDRVKERMENLSPIEVHEKPSPEKCFSYQKLLSEYDAQRRLTVDKVMRERIQNMYDASKIIRDSLEHLKQTRQEEAIARRLHLERKILDEIHEQEVLNRPKREAQWAKDNLKEAQRIQERNQRVKEAEEEAKKKSEAILLKRKQIDKILLTLQKEYDQEYKQMLETIKLCKDKAALTEFTATQSKSLKDCAGIFEGLLKKCKQGDVNEDDVSSAKNLIETLKLIHECFAKEVTRINEAFNAKKEESVKKTEVEQVPPVKGGNEPSTPTDAPSSASEYNGEKRSGLSSGLKNFGQVDKGTLSSGALKRKSLRSDLNALGAKPQKWKGAHDEDVNGKSRGRVKSNSIGSLKSKRKSSNSEDFFEEGDAQRLRNKSLNALPKKYKKVRFSESREIIESDYPTTIFDLTQQILGPKISYKEINAEGPFKDAGCFREDPEDEDKFKYLSDCFDAKSLELYLNLKNLLETYEKSIQPLLADESLKKFRFSCQKAVTIPVNAISPVSGSHLSDKYSKLHNLLSGKPVEVGDTKVAASQHPLGVAYCKYLLAKKFVRQGDLTVSSKPDAAFSIATVLASLWIDFPDFGQLVLAHFQSACPYLAPVFMPQIEGQSDEDYHKSLGYHYSQNGEVEKQDSFLKRMSGIMRLYAALLISNVRQPGKMNPLGLSEGWRWISSLLNLEPRPDICATLLYDFLEVAGNEMFRAYGGQFRKILAYICQEYFPKLEKVTPSSAGGPMVRLEGFLQKVLKEESIPPPQGALPPNFW